MRLADIRNDFSCMFKFDNRKALSIVLVILCSLLIALVAIPVYSIMRGGRFAEIGISYIIENYSLKNIYRAGFAFVAVFFVLIHFIVRIPVFYNFVFKYRYVFAVSAFLILVLCRIHFSSIGMFDFFIQHGYGSEFVTPLLGNPNLIRSDEYAVTTPVHLSAQFGPEAYGRYNFIARGTATENMPFGLTFNLATLAFPLSIFYLFGVEYGFSARWVGMLIMTFMVAFEFVYIISGKNRLLALAGACLIAFSPFFQWWSYVLFITAGLGTLVCFYYFLNVDSRVKRLLFALGIAVFFSMFIVIFYPAWQVPAGYLYLGLAAWIVVENREKIRKLGKLDWGIFGAMMLLIAAVVGTYLYESREYIASISNTIYPGTRHMSGGDINFSEFTNRMMNAGVFGPISAARAFAQTNQSEFGGIYTLFPIPLIFMSYMMIRKKVFDLLSIILIAFTVVAGIYVYFGWPEWLARVTLMSLSMTARVLDVILFAQVFLLIRALSWLSVERKVDAKAGISEEGEAGERETEERETEEGEIKETKTPKGIKALNKTTLIKIAGAVVVGGILAAIAMLFYGTTFTTSIRPLFLAFIFAGFALVLYCMFSLQRSRRIFTAACLYLILISSVTWMAIHPIMKGLDVIYSKPLSVRVSELAVNTDEKWISLYHVFYGPSFLIASGASTINSTNFYPNLELWHRLDPERNYEEIYNRYAHISVELTTENTSFVLWHSDHMLLRLSYRDLETAGVKFIHTEEPLADNEYVYFTLLYNEGGSRIYSVIYK